ncbi:MAG: redox-regulated ATPase YchF [Myxococcota bacterium]
MALRCGIVGLPNVGKSTIFNALTAAGVAAENYPFCTIEPNSGVVPVPDPRLEAVNEIVRATRAVPASVEFIDIAGLVKGASQGEGLGNKFLAHVRETHALVHVIRCFEHPNVAHVEGELDPVRDAETVATELALADLDAVERRLERVRRAAKAGGVEEREEFAFLESLLAHISAGAPAAAFAVPEPCRAAFGALHLLTAKPVLYVANVAEAELAEPGEQARALEAYAEHGATPILRLCGKVEAELAELDAESRRLFLAELGLPEPGLHRLIRAAYELLGLITFFSATQKEVRAWTVRRGTLAPQAAGEIHSDFERHFVGADVASFEEFVAAGGEAAARADGTLRLEGRDYAVRDGDVIHFRAAV